MKGQQKSKNAIIDKNIHVTSLQRAAGIKKRMSGGPTCKTGARR
jgi:hypothetical protein